MLLQFRNIRNRIRARRHWKERTTIISHLAARAVTRKREAERLLEDTSSDVMKKCAKLERSVLQLATMLAAKQEEARAALSLQKSLGAEAPNFRKENWKSQFAPVDSWMKMLETAYADVVSAEETIRRIHEKHHV